MQIGMRQVSAETVEWFGTACRGGELTRTALARVGGQHALGQGALEQRRVEVHIGGLQRVGIEGAVDLISHWKYLSVG